MIDVVGHRVLIEPEHFESEVGEGSLKGFKLDVTDDWKRDRAQTVIGILRGIGPNAWVGFDDGKPWAKVGDRVYYAKYSGKTVEFADDMYIVCNDEDVIAIIRDED